MRVKQGLIRGIAVALGLWAGSASAGEALRLDAQSLDRVTAGLSGGFAYFFGGGTAAYNGTGNSVIEGGGDATYNEEISYTPSTGVKYKLNAKGSYKGSSKAEVPGGGTAAATLTAGSGVVRF